MHLFLTTVALCALLVFSKFIIKKINIASWLGHKINEIPIELKEQLKVAQNDLKEIQKNDSSSNNNEYVKLILQMRAQRKVDDVKEKILQKRNAAVRQAAYFELIFIYVVKAFLYITLIFISVRNRYTPVFVFDKQFNLQPLKGLLSFPTGVANAISVPIWILSCKVTFNMLSRLIKGQV